MTEGTRPRLDLARRISPSYACNPKVAAIVVHGSVARGWSDRYSDLEMKAFWLDPPSDDERVDAIQRAGGNVRQLYPYERENIDWSDEFYVDDIKVDMSHSTTADVDQCMTDVTQRFDPSLLKQQIVAQIRYGIPLHGGEQLASWKAQAASYPDGLVQAMLRQHLALTPRWKGKMLLARHDWLALHEALGSDTRAILTALLVLNRIYIQHVGLKWVDRQIAEMQIAPVDLSLRLERILHSDPHEGLQELHTLTEETFELVAHHLPCIDIAVVRKRYRDSSRFKARESEN